MRNIGPAFCLGIVFSACAPNASLSPPASESPGVDGGGEVPDVDVADAPSAQPDVPAVHPACSELEPRTVPVTVTAGPEAADKPFVDVLSKATRTIRLMVYEMGRGGIMDTLKKKAHENVDVRIILDKAQQSVNQKYMDELVAAGAKVQWSDPQFTYMHAKMFVVDESDAMISTGNYSLYQIRRERNFAGYLTDPADVAVLVSLFEADWNRKAPDASCTRLLISPINAKERILSLIRNTKKTLVIESMQFADTDVRKEVANRKEAGVDVRVILADPSWIDTNNAAASFLKARSIPVKWMVSPNVHVKAIVSDGVLAYIGSENLSYTSLNKNREVGLILTGVESTAVNMISTTFDADWNHATSF